MTELLHVQETLDREKFPERAKIVDAEIQRRINAGEKIEEPYSAEEEEASYELIIDFHKGEKTTHRQLFIGAVLPL